MEVYIKELPVYVKARNKPENMTAVTFSKDIAVYPKDMSIDKEKVKIKLIQDMQKKMGNIFDTTDIKFEFYYEIKFRDGYCRETFRETDIAELSFKTDVMAKAVILNEMSDSVAAEMRVTKVLNENLHRFVKDYVGGFRFKVLTKAQLDNGKRSE